MTDWTLLTSSKFNSKGAHFLKEDVGLFDAAFFGISPVEAKVVTLRTLCIVHTLTIRLGNRSATEASPRNHLRGHGERYATNRGPCDSIIISRSRHHV